MNKLSRSVLNISLTFCALTSANSQSSSQSKLHTPAEIIAIMEKSDLVYNIGLDFNQSTAIDSPIVNSNQMYLKESTTRYTLEFLKISDEFQPIFQQAEEAFQKEEYSKAITLYNKLYELQPNYFYALTLIGDSYFNKGQYDSSKVFFQQAIKMNFADYQAHWFLADTYEKLNLPDSALTEITIAHLLNINHSNIKKGLQYYRKKLDRSWEEWDFKPQYSISKDDNKITINSTENWLGYAIVKAVWKYEPGYAESMIGKSDAKSLINWREEKEAVLATLTDTTKSERITNIINDDFFSEFVIYEITAKKYPSIIVLLPREMFWRMREYINKYH